MIEPIVLPVACLYLAFVFLSWTAGPLFDLLLRLNRFGRLALTPRQRVASNCVGGLLLGGVILAGAALLMGQPVFLAPAIGAVMMILPVSACFNASKPGRRNLLTGYTLVLATIGAAVAALLVFDPPAGMTPGGVFFFGWVAFSWFANLTALRR